MSEESGDKRTGLYDWHVAQNANMGHFGGYRMPLWYGAGAKQEHLSVITGVGLFDTSHMAFLTLEGKGALALLQASFSRDLRACVGRNRRPLAPGVCVYGVFLDEKGGVIDDAVVSQLSEDLYLVVVNAGMGEPVAQHLCRFREEASRDEVSVTDWSGRTGKVDLQGPRAAGVLQAVLADSEDVLKGMTYFSCKGHFDGTSPLTGTVRTSGGIPLLLSRTGYTGEFGFELLMEAQHLPGVWNALMEAGVAHGLLPCGLAARDSLRVGALLPLSHQDIGPWPFWNNPWMFVLPHNLERTGFTKPFHGDKALQSLRECDHTHAFLGYDLRKVSTGDETVVLNSEGRPMGRVLSCTTDMALGRQEGRVFSIASPDRPEGFKPRGLSCGFIKVPANLQVGQSVRLRDSRREIRVEIVDSVRPDRTARSCLSRFLLSNI